MRLHAFGAVALVVACSHPAVQTSTEVARPITLPSGTVAVLTTVDGGSCRDAAACAQMEALRTLLFVGVPGSRIPRPMVANEAEAGRDHRAFFEQLLRKDGYRHYVIRATPDAPPNGSVGNARAFTVIVNSEALRTALEREGIVRRFGY